MKAFRVFIFGLLFGWLIKVAIDRIYRDNDVEDLLNENASLQEYIRSLEAKLQARSSGSRAVTQTATQPEPSKISDGSDDLKVIKGIGPAIEKKLNAAGIHTFEALARLTVAELETILGSTRRLVKEGNLITQAETLAQQKNKP